MFKTILVPIDGSDHARKATELAGDIAEKYGAEVVLLHVAIPGSRLPDGLRRMAEVEHLVDPNASAGSMPAGSPGDTVAAVRDSRDADIQDQASARVGQWLLNQAEKTLNDKGTQQVATRLESGDPAEAILASADDVSANLIVMGSRGLSKLEGLLMGSVSNKVSQLSSCSCITVK